jgi:hypothetical protein
MKKAGIIVLLIGLVFTGFSFITREMVVDIGKLEISTKRNHPISWAPIAGVIGIAIGSGLCLPGRRNSPASETY